MKKRKPMVYILSAVILLIAAVTLYQIISRSETTLEFTVQDAVSGAWIWDLEAVLGDSIIHGYYQSDSGVRPFKFRNIETGKYTLELSAPYYESLTVPFKIKKGKNIVSEPLEMYGTGIPDLKTFFVFEELVEDEFLMNLRPVSNSGTAIINHPCINLVVGCRVSEQVTETGYAEEKIETGAGRGKELFRGRLNWVWDSTPEVQFRYYSGLLEKNLEKSEAPYLVFDYLICVPEIGKITDEELEDIINQAYLIPDQRELVRFLQGYSDQFSFYIDTSWNVRREND